MSKTPPKHRRRSPKNEVDAAVDAVAELMVCSMLAPVLRDKRADETAIQRNTREFTENVHVERLEAIRQLLQGRAFLVPLMEKAGIDSSPLFEIELLIKWSDDEQARARVLVFERLFVVLGRLAALLDAGATQRVRRDLLPLTELQQQVWDCIEGKALLSKEIRKQMPWMPSDEAIRKHVQSIRQTGRQIAYVPRQGYVRPDAPPET